MRLAFRTGWPPALAVIGRCRCSRPAPRPATTHRRPSAALAAGTGVLVLFVLVCGWVRMRSRIHAWWRAQMELAGRG